MSKLSYDELVEIFKPTGFYHPSDANKFLADYYCRVSSPTQMRDWINGPMRGLTVLSLDIRDWERVDDRKERIIKRQTIGLFIHSHDSLALLRAVMTPAQQKEYFLLLSKMDVPFPGFLLPIEHEMYAVAFASAEQCAVAAILAIQAHPI